ncbi:MAG: hypothetical protein WAW91_01155 [Candidatus Nanoperiomorbaceae bacterium]
MSGGGGWTGGKVGRVMTLELNLLPDVKKEYQKALRQRNLVVSIAIFASLISAGVIVALLLTMGGLQVQKSILLGQIGADGTGQASSASSDSYIGKIKKAQTSSQSLNSVLTIQNDLSQLTKLKKSQPAFSRLFYAAPNFPGILSQINPADPVEVALQQVQLGTSASGSGGSTAATAASGTAGAATGADTMTLQGTAWNQGNPNGGYDALNTYATTLKSATVSYASLATKNKVVTEKLFPSVTVTQQQLGQGQGQSQGQGGASDGANSPVTFTIVVSYNKAIFDVDSTNISFKVPHQTSSDAISNAPKSTFSGNGSAPTSANNQGGSQ